MNVVSIFPIVSIEIHSHQKEIKNTYHIIHKYK